MSVLVLLATAFLLSLALTNLVRSLAPRLGLVDVPNERSLHARPKPRGGGAGIAVGFLGAVAFLTIQRELSLLTGGALLVGGAIVATMGLLDDRFRLPDAIRLPVWIAVAAGASLALGGLPAIDLGAFVLPLGVLGWLLAVLGIVWSINLYNFMDGIDGLAASQGVIAAAAGGGMLWAAGERGLALASLSLATAAMGFLIWNWPPARIFMGDVGSGFLGFSFACLAVLSERSGGPPIASWAILLAPFLVDATFTLIARALRREPFYKPHREHAYQRAVRAGRSHQAVTLMYAAFALALVPVAWLAWRAPLARLPLALGVVLLLGLLWRTQRHNATGSTP